MLCICLDMVVSYAAEPAKISRAQAEIFQKHADQTRTLRTEASQSFVCTQTGTLAAGPALLSKARDIVLDAQTAFAKTGPSNLQVSASSKLFSGLLTRNNEARMSLADLTAGNCGDLRTASRGSIYDQERAFAAVSRQESMTFDLKVSSDPAGATITYRRAGDKGYQTHNGRTETTIENLDWAIWFIKLDAAGYVSDERAFNPYTERIPSLHVQLDRVSK
jgi:hypothetical protein